MIDFYVVQCTLKRRHIVIFSGGANKAVLSILEDRVIRAGGGFSSIIDCDSFQRNRLVALGLLDHMIRIYNGEMS